MKKDAKCVWSGKRDPRVITITLNSLSRFTKPEEKTFYVLPEYEQNLRDFNEKLVAGGRTFLILIIGLIVLLQIVALVAITNFFSDAMILYVVGVITALIGVVIIRYPFATPETVKWLGYKKSITLARAAGYLTIAIGVGMFLI